MKHTTTVAASPAVENRAEDFSFLPAPLAEALAAQGIVRPTDVQARTIPVAITGRDVLAQSETGSGKTLAFGLAMALRLAGRKSRGVGALVLTPTRELAAQVERVLGESLGVVGLRTLAITGGASYQKQKRALSGGVDVAVGTPGRICDLMEQGVLDLSGLSVFVLDEVDQMLDVGFSEELKKVRAQLSESVQTLFFSATLSRDIRELARGLLRDPEEIRLGEARGRIPETIEHGYLEVREGAEQKALVNALLFHNPERALIFCKTRQECGELAEALAGRGFSAAALHGDLSQQERNGTLEKFREKRLQYLISTNVAARGIDVQELPLVVNYSVPYDVESYTHRVGRTGRNGASGKAWTLVTSRSCRTYEFLMRKMHLVPVQVEVPSSSQVINRALEVQVQDLLRGRAEGGNRTVEKAVARALDKLGDDERLVLLRELLVRRLEKMETFYTDDVVCTRKLVRLGPDDWERKPQPRGVAAEKRAPSERKDAWSAKGKTGFSTRKPAFAKAEKKFSKEKRGSWKESNRTDGSKPPKRRERA